MIALYRDDCYFPPFPLKSTHLLSPPPPPAAKSSDLPPKK